MKLEKWDLETLKKEPLRWAKIHVWGKVLRVLVDNNGNLKDFLNNFEEKIWIQTTSSPRHKENLSQLKSTGNVISLNHVMWNFSDYIPFLNTLPEDVLKNTYFFSIHQTSPMFQREFPELADRCIAQNWTPRENYQKLLQALSDVKEGKSNIFIMPRTEVSDEEKIKSDDNIKQEIELAQRTFLAIQKRLPENTPWLEWNVWFWWDYLSYAQIYKRASWIWNEENILARVDSSMTTIGT